MKKRVNAGTIFDVFNVVFMLFIIFVTAYPIYYVLIASFSDADALSRTTGALWLPLQPYTLRAYEMVFSTNTIVKAFFNTLYILVFGLIVNMVMTSLGAFFLTIKGPRLKNAIAMMIVFTMYFSGGMVPSYLNIKDLGLLDSRWAVILPAAVSTMNLIILKSAFEAIPDSLLESARLDGASYLQVLTKIMIPLSKATLAVLVLYYGVAHWNGWFSASIYLRNSDLFPLQLVMRNLLNVTTASLMGGAGADDMVLFANHIKYALIVVATAPILMIYPFLQKYFVKGVMIGAVKG